MTNKEAVEILTVIKNTPTITWENGADIAFDLAIKALEEVDSLRDTAEYYERELEEKWECGIDEEEA